MPTESTASQSFQKSIFRYIEELLGVDNILAVSRVILALCGDLETGIFLSQLMYWADKGKSPHGWIYKTDKEWHDELFLTPYAIRKVRRNLTKAGIIETKKKRANGFPTIHYRIDKKSFRDHLKTHIEDMKQRRPDSAKSESRSYENEETITETTTEKKNIFYKETYTHHAPPPGRSVSFQSVIGDRAMDEEQKDAIIYFLGIYHQHMGDEHPWLRPEEWQYAANQIFLIDDDGDEYDTELAEAKARIDRYFQTEFKDGSNYNILHFIQNKWS